MHMADFVTAVTYKLPIKVVIIKNNTLGQIKWEQMVFLGNPEYGLDLHPLDFAAFAHACGGVGFQGKIAANPVHREFGQTFCRMDRRDPCGLAATQF
jgi:thiamine pyrophosphate-dependent acetolactate synthase large subunit-like protein